MVREFIQKNFWNNLESLLVYRGTYFMSTWNNFQVVNKHTHTHTHLMSTQESISWLLCGALVKKIVDRRRKTQEKRNFLVAVVGLIMATEMGIMHTIVCNWVTKCLCVCVCVHFDDKIVFTQNVKSTNLRTTDKKK